MEGEQQGSGDSRAGGSHGIEKFLDLKTMRLGWAMDKRDGMNRRRPVTAENRLTRFHV
jgi:hypothetical protein